MSINFGKAKVDAKVKSEDRRATIRYHADSGAFFAILHNGVVMPIKEDYLKAKHYYCRPSNDTYEKWFKRTNGRTTPISPKSLKVIKTYWATVKPKLKVVGSIKDDVFVIKYK